MTTRPMYKNRKEQYPLPIFEDVKEEVIVSLTSYGERIKHIMPTIKSLQEQSRRPDRIVVYIANEDKDNVTDELKNAELVEIRYCQDTRSHKKFQGYFDFPDAYVTTADDDLIYFPEWLKTMLKTSQIDRRAVVANNTFLLEDWEFRRQTSRKDNSRSLKGELNMYVMTGAGVLRPPKIDLSLLKYAFNFSPFCDERPLSCLLRYLNIPVLATSLHSNALHKESYKLSTGGLWEQHNCKNQNLRGVESKAFITYIKKLDEKLKK